MPNNGKKPQKCEHLHWHISLDNIGVCQNCGAVKNFNPANRKVFAMASRKSPLGTYNIMEKEIAELL